MSPTPQRYWGNVFLSKKLSYEDNIFWVNLWVAGLHVGLMIRSCEAGRENFINVFY